MSTSLTWHRLRACRSAYSGSGGRAISALINSSIPESFKKTLTCTTANVRDQ